MNAARPYSLSSLYIILDPSVCPERPLTEVLTAAAEAGASLFQYRNKTGSMKEAYVEALALRQTAAKAGVRFIVNDRCDLALAVDADGVHLGQGDLPLDLARKVMGQNKLIGISTHNPDQVREATAGKPDYLGFGPIFKPYSKQDHDPVVGLEGLRAMRSLTSLIGALSYVHVGPSASTNASICDTCTAVSPHVHGSDSSTSASPPEPSSPFRQPPCAASGSRSSATRCSRLHST